MTIHIGSFDLFFIKTINYMHTKILEIMNTVLKNRGRDIVNELNEDLRLTQIGFDSLDLAELTVRIEAVYDVDIFEDGIIDTVGEIFEKIGNKK